MPVVALSPNASAVLTLLRPDGGLANIARLKRDAGLSEDEFATAQAELLDSRLVVLSGARLRRTAGAAADLTPDAQLMLASLPEDGSTVGNYSLRSDLDLDDERYAAAKRELRAAGLLTVGVGYGGTVSRASSARPPDSRPVSGGVAREPELYEPFVGWLRSSLEDQDLAFAHARVTATPRGYRRDGGKWSRPDATSVQVFRYECLPEIRVEVSSYEIKRAGDADDLEIVYEAAAHGRWAHRASLVVEQIGDGRPVPPAVFQEASRFNLGLYAMRRRSDGEFDVRELIQPPLTPESQPEDVNDLLVYYLSQDRKIRDAYMRAIGR